jgi:replicative superfamily II helicase
MALLARFIGIDRHADPQIRDLTGARRDATGLWALFCDSIPDLDSRLIVDTAATVDGIRAALDQSLGSAGPEDTVILTFSGHGTHDHRLVAHDTRLDALATTTISMDELATRFKASQAKAVLCILDCCFSGGAPARVLEESPIPRDPGPALITLAGNGRLLVAASNIDEEAYEHPITRHGLLTKAVLDTLLAAGGPLNLLTAMDLIFERVRAEAARLGIEQTPVSLGYIEGGLTLPALQIGERYRAAFPDVVGIRVDHLITDLAAFGIPDVILAAWSARFAQGLNDLQRQAVNEHRVLDGASLLVIAPTSAGKTFIGELAATRAIVEGRKAVFLLPYRALVNEKFEDFSHLYDTQLGMRVVRCSGDYLDQTGPFVRGKYDLAVLTYEMFLNLVVGNPSVFQQIGLVVLDEAQFITDPTRGITVELLLTYLLMARERGVCPQLLALSAVIGQVNAFDDWLGCAALITTERPVRLVEGVLDRSGVFQYCDETGHAALQQLLPIGAVVMRREKPKSQDVIVPLVHQLVAEGEKVIVFRNQRGAAQGCANYLSDELGLRPATEALAQLPTHDLSTTSTALRKCLQGGTAFHSTNLNREERVVVEAAFRDPNGPVRVLAATTTVAAGINTPASTVILAEQEFRGEDGRPFTVAEYKNMAGRAGRLGFNEHGKAIVLAETTFQREQLFDRYVMGQLEPLQSSFDPRDLETWIVRLLAQVSDVPRQDVARLLANTYGGYVATRRHPDWRPQMEQQLEALLERMLGLDLVEQEGDQIRLTLLGRACGRATISLGSAMRLVDLLRRIGPDGLTAEILMVVVQVLRESDNGYTPMQKRGQAESVRPREAVARVGPETTRLLQRFAADDWDYIARCKRVAILWDWIHGIAIEEIERRYSTNPFQGVIGHGDVRRFADATRFHLRSAQQLATVLFVGEGPSEEAVDALLKQLETGLPTDALGLLALTLPLTRGEYLALRAAGLVSVTDLATCSIDALGGAVGEERAAQIKAVATMSP